MIKETQTIFALIMVGALIYIIYKQKDVLKEKMGSSMANELMNKVG